jgi:SulP family sulfate permease
LTKNLDERWLPASVLCLRDYSLNTFLHDLVAGVTVGLVALPLAMAFAIASGLTPQAGIYCAVVTGFLISALGGSKTQIGGPTGAFVVVVAGIVAVHGIDGLFMCTVMAGVLLVILGATGITLKTGVCTSCRTKTFLTTQAFSAFMGHSCLGRRIKPP